MKKFYLLSAILMTQVFCFVAENCSAHIEDISERPKLGENFLEPVHNAD